MADMDTLLLESVEFVQPCPANLRCRRCSGLQSSLQRGRCGHGFCGRCVEFVRAPRFQCPVDSRSIEKKELVVDNEIKKKIQDLSVFCLQKKRGCKRTLQLLDLENHLENCGFVPVSCPCNCGLQVTKRDLAHHLTTSCDRRLVSCPFCQEDIVYKELDNHNQVCGKRPVTCNHCRAEIKREQQQAHEFSCPMKPRNCALADTGCTFKGNAEELDLHGQDVHAHMQLVSGSMAQFRLDMKNLEGKVDESATEISKLREQIEDLYPLLGTVKLIDKKLTSLQEQVKKLEIAEQTVEEMNETLNRLREYMQGAQPAVVQDHKSRSPQGSKSPESISPPGLFSHNSSFEDHRPKHAAPPTDL